MRKLQDEKCKRRNHKIKLVEEIKKNIRQLNFKVLVLELYCFCVDNVKYRLLSKKTSSKESNNMQVEKTSMLQ